MSSDSDQMLRAWLERIERKLDGVIRDGCARAPDHTELRGRVIGAEERICVLERETSKSAVKWSIVSVLAVSSIGSLWHVITSGLRK